MNTESINAPEQNQAADGKKKIVFLDYDLNNYHANTFLNLLRGDLAGSGYIISGCRALKAESGREWADKSEIPFLEEDSDMEVDGIAVLAPSNPEVHAALVKEACRFKAPIYVDKTFAQSLAEADAMFQMADRAGVPIFTSSALRYADELAELREWNAAGTLQQMQVYAGGATASEYLVHPLETLISTMGTDIVDYDHKKTGSLEQIRLVFQRGSIGTIFMYPKSQAGFRVVGATPEKTVHLEITSPIFKNLLTQILSFFSLAKEPVERVETQTIISLLQKTLAN